jgi:4-hydroxy-tetrahydrodipicolinate synthase
MVTPFKRTPKQELDLEALRRHTSFLLSSGVNGVMPLGTTGEFSLLNRQERGAVVRTVAETVSGKIPVIAGVSESGTENAVALANDAAHAGADLVIATAPYYYKTNDRGLYIHYQSILDAIELPLMIYNIPSWVGYNVPPSTVKRLVQENPSRVVGVKFTTNDMVSFIDYLRMLQYDVSIFIGSDALIFAALSVGAAGAVAACANAFPRETVRIYKYFKKRDLATSRQIQKELGPFARKINMGTYPSALKEALSILGYDCGPVRRPLVPLTKNERIKLKASLMRKTSHERNNEQE